MLFWMDKPHRFAYSVNFFGLWWIHTSHSSSFKSSQHRDNNNDDTFSSSSTFGDR